MAGLEFVPALQVQRDLYDIPRGKQRFERYLKVMLNDDRTDLDLPLPAFNPMGGENVKEALDKLLAIDAESVVLDVLASLEDALRIKGMELPGGPVSLVLVDDVGGQWTHRELVESQIAGFHPSVKRSYSVSSWVLVHLWSSEAYSKEGIEIAVRSTIFRRGWFRDNGVPKTLRDVLIQEAQTRYFAGDIPAVESQSELVKIFAVIQGFLASDHFPTMFSCCYGDRIAESAGYAMLDLPERAGFRLPLEWLGAETHHRERRPLSETIVRSSQ